jgi:hypothetical protein
MSAGEEWSDHVGWGDAPKSDDTQENEQLPPTGYRGRRRRAGFEPGPGPGLVPPRPAAPPLAELATPPAAGLPMRPAAGLSPPPLAGPDPAVAPVSVGVARAAAPVPPAAGVTPMAPVPPAAPVPPRAATPGGPSRSGADPGAAPESGAEEEEGGRSGRVLLTAAVVGVLLLVLTVWVRWPRDDGNAAPPNNTIDSTETFPDDYGPGDPTVGPSGSRSPRANKPTPSASGTGSPTPGATPTPTPSPSPSPEVPFQPISMEAEAGALNGGTTRWDCSTCSGKVKVRFIGHGVTNYVTLTVNATSGGTRQLQIIYEVDSTARTFFVSVNGGPALTVTVTGNGWSTPANTSRPITLNAGTNTIKFFNTDTTAYAPDLDAIRIA